MKISAQDKGSPNVSVVDLNGGRINMVESFDTETKEAVILVTCGQRIAMIEGSDGKPTIAKVTVRLPGCRLINNKTGVELK